MANEKISEFPEVSVLGAEHFIPVVNESGSPFLNEKISKENMATQMEGLPVWIKRGFFSTQTVGATTSEINITVDAFGSVCVKLDVVAKNTGDTLGFVSGNSSFVRTIGSAFVEVVNQISDFGGGVVVVVTSPNASTIKIAVTGESGETINWNVFYEIISI